MVRGILGYCICPWTDSRRNHHYGSYLASTFFRGRSIRLPVSLQEMVFLCVLPTARANPLMTAHRHKPTYLRCGHCALDFLPQPQPTEKVHFCGSSEDLRLSWTVRPPIHSVSSTDAKSEPSSSSERRCSSSASPLQQTMVSVTLGHLVSSQQEQSS